MKRTRRFFATLPLTRGASAFAFLLLTPRDASAVEPPDGTIKALPCRPTIACTADIVEPGALEIEAGMLFRRLDGTGRQWTFPFLAKLTMARWLQLQVGSNGFTTLWNDAPRARYFDSVAGGVKIHALDQTELVPALAFSAALAVPTPHDQVGYTPSYDALFTGYATKDYGPLHADLNLGLTEWGLDGSPQAQEWIALAVSAPLPPPFGVMVEGYYFSDAPPLGPQDGGFLFALCATPRPWLVFDAGGDVGYFPSKRAFSAFVGMTLVPAVLWR